MERAGGIAVSELLSNLEADLRDYYGALNEIKMGLKAKLPPKPEALIRYEQCQALGLPLVSGGVIDQPYLWLQELAVVIEQDNLFRILEARNKADKPT